MAAAFQGRDEHYKGFIMKILSLIVLIGLQASAGIVCVGPSATGNGAGTDWNNLKAWTSSPARGDTWYFIDGTYAGKTFSTANSGTTLITVKKATISNHGGISPGWLNTMGDGQASFTGTLVVQTSYWLFDGQTGDGASVVPADTTPSHYGFNFSDGENAIYLGNTSSTTTDTEFRHIYSKATSSDVEKMFCQGQQQTSYVRNNVTISHCLLDGWQGGFMTRGGYSSSYQNLLWQYNVCLNGSSSPANHGEWINPNESALLNAVIRYNVFKGGTDYQTGTIVANNQNNTGATIYGNVFDGVQVGNGIITGTSAGDMNSVVVYNNTFLNCSMLTDLWVSGPGSGNNARNNLLYNMPAAVGGWTHDYNAFYSTTGTPPESNRQLATGNPFNNSAGMDYTLKTNTLPGSALPSPYDLDPTGKPRSNWTRGAFEFGSASANPLISITPISAEFGAVVVGTTRDQDFTVKNNGAGTLAGTASVTVPYSVVSGASYSLQANQSQTVTVRFSPTSAGTFSRTVTFTGGGGATVSVSGTGTSVASNSPPIVSVISQNASDVDPNTPGAQVYEGTAVQYSGSASDPNGDALTWQWIYTVNGGAEVVAKSGSGSVTAVSYSYAPGTGGSTYVWKLRVSDGLTTSERTLTVGVEAPPTPPGTLSFSATSGTISGPFEVSNGAIYQAVTTGVAEGGRAVYGFTLTTSGRYAIQALVSATSMTGNSFYVNIDAEPTDPAMAWDIIPVTSGFQQRLISWRGSGTAEADEFVPKIFNLASGPHQLIIRGREADTYLQSLSILQLPNPPQNLRITVGP